MRLRPGSGDYAPQFEGYIGLVPEGELPGLLREQGEATQSLLKHRTEEQGLYRYAEGKWSLKEVLGHIADVERVMSYRLLRASRGDRTPLPGFSEQLFIEGAGFHKLPLEQLAEELWTVRAATLSLLAGLSTEAWQRSASVNKYDTSALALACIILGHEKHHVKIIHERYLSL